MALSSLHKSLALEEWAALKRGNQKDDPFERPVGALDLFILEDGPEGDIDDVSVGELLPLNPFWPIYHANLPCQRA